MEEFFIMDQFWQSTLFLLFLIKPNTTLSRFLLVLIIVKTNFRFEINGLLIISTGQLIIHIFFKYMHFYYIKGRFSVYLFHNIHKSQIIGRCLFSDTFILITNGLNAMPFIWLSFLILNDVVQRE